MAVRLSALRAGRPLPPRKIRGTLQSLNERCVLSEYGSKNKAPKPSVTQNRQNPLEPSECRCTENMFEIHAEYTVEHFEVEGEYIEPLR
jgi:hypothetical protein